MNVTLLTGAAQITAESSLMDKLSLGGSTLLLGMAIVFAVLGIIYIALQIMRAIFTKNTKKTKKEASAPIAAVKAEAVEQAPVAEPAGDDAAIVAAIIAAISAYTGKAPEGFRVVSFKKRK